ncbi:hypothetical protein SGRA_0913 [Saprospira grandis str. Lewin]|uniref:Uncharacterized protein n=1 Tax=Saprospira grandis (strain Lewin) TaxID=984262 RepID=H6L2J1_SAPGL|nr:hypothetical protein SGRA_0913 [Saprospira grandis str. Lewin]
MLSSFCFCVYVKVVTFNYKRKVSLKFLSKVGRRPFGLAMWSSAAQPQTQAVRPQGRADLRAAQRSADDRREAEAPKEKNFKTEVGGFSSSFSFSAVS